MFSPLLECTTGDLWGKELYNRNTCTGKVPVMKRYIRDKKVNTCIKRLCINYCVWCSQSCPRLSLSLALVHILYLSPSLLLLCLNLLLPHYNQLSVFPPSSSLLGSLSPSLFLKHTHTHRFAKSSLFRLLIFSSSLSHSARLTSLSPSSCLPSFFISN